MSAPGGAVFGGAGMMGSMPGWMLPACAVAPKLASAALVTAAASIRDELRRPTCSFGSSAAVTRRLLLGSRRVDREGGASGRC